MESFWWLFALFKAWGGAGTVLLTERQTRSSVELVWLRSLCASIIFSGCFYFPLPEDLKFYIYAFLVGFCVFLGDKIIFHSCQLFGALAVSRFMPLSIFGSFALWLAVDDKQLSVLLSSPVLFASILMSLFGAIIAISKMRKGSGIANAAFIALLPTIVIFALCDLFATLAVQSQSPFIGAAYFAFFVTLSTFICSTSYLFFKEKNLKPVKVDFKIALLLGVLHAASSFGMMSAFYFSPNPGFVMALGLSVPLWVLMYHKFKKIPDDYGNMKAGLLFLFSALLLVYLSSYLK